MSVSVAAAEILENTAYIYLLSAASEGGMCSEVRRGRWPRSGCAEAPLGPSGCADGSAAAAASAAMNLAIDRDELVEKVLGGSGRPLYSTFSPVHLGGRPLAGAPCANTHPDAVAAQAVAVAPLPERQAQARESSCAPHRVQSGCPEPECVHSTPQEHCSLGLAMRTASFSSKLASRPAQLV